MNFITELYIVSALQIIIAIGLLNVWLVRFHKPTKYRGAGAGDMEQEFRAYGLPVWFMYIIGAVKLTIAAVMIIGLWMPVVVVSAACVLGVLMIGAISMHAKVHDNIVRTIPAILMFAMAVGIIVIKM
jgi:hypothetical protein